MMILSQMALIVKVKLFEYSVTTMTKNSSSWAYQLQTLLFRCLMLLHQAITSLFQIEIITRTFHSLISATLLLCRAVFFNPFAAAWPSANACVAPGTLCDDPIVYSTICSKPDGWKWHYQSVLAGPLAATRRTLRLCGTPIEKHWCRGQR